MSGTTKITNAQFATLQRSVEETGVGVVDITLNESVNGIVNVDFKTPYGTLLFRIDRHGRRLPRV